MAELADRSTADSSTAGRSTIVALHAHPDDEALLSGGTLAMLTATGHRVVLVVATAGEAGLANSAPTAGEAGLANSAQQLLAQRRVAEVEASAAVLGIARVVHLGYPDSGWVEHGRGTLPAGCFAAVDIEEPARRLADILIAENADVLTSYDRNGGYGHPDHVRVHDVAVAAAELAHTPRIMQVTIDRTLLGRAVRLLGALRLLPAETATERASQWFSGRDEITHRIDTRKYSNAKKLALRCHTSQTEAGSGLRTATLLLRLPGPLFRRVCGTEWFVEHGTHPTQGTLTDFFASTGRRITGIRDEVTP